MFPFEIFESHIYFEPTPSLSPFPSSFNSLYRLKLLAALFKKTTFVLAISRQRQRFPPASLKSALFVHRVEFSLEFSFPRGLLEGSGRWYRYSAEQRFQRLITIVETGFNSRYLQKTLSSLTTPTFNPFYLPCPCRIIRQ